MKILDKSLEFLQIGGLFLILYVFSEYYIVTFEILAVKCCHGVYVKCSQYRDTSVTDPALPTIKTSRQFLALSSIHSGFWLFTGLVFGIGAL